MYSIQTWCRKERPCVGTGLSFSHCSNIFHTPYLSWCAPTMMTSSSFEVPLILTIYGTKQKIEAKLNINWRLISVAKNAKTRRCLYVHVTTHQRSKKSTAGSIRIWEEQSMIPYTSFNFDNSHNWLCLPVCNGRVTSLFSKQWTFANSLRCDNLRVRNEHHSDVRQGHTHLVLKLVNFSRFDIICLVVSVSITALTRSVAFGFGKETSTQQSGQAQE